MLTKATVETGEEEERTYFSCKAKLYQFSDKEWRERGIGTFKVNVKLVNGKEDKKATRMIMRADGVGRVMLNTPLFKGMTVGDASGKEPKSKQIHLASFENGRSVPTLLRVSFNILLVRIGSRTQTNNQRHRPGQTRTPRISIGSSAIY